MIINVAGEQFKSKKALYERLRTILYRYPFGSLASINIFPALKDEDFQRECKAQ